MEYSFVKQVNTEILNNEIAAAGLGSEWVSTSLTGSLLKIEFRKTLNKKQFDVLHSLILNHKMQSQEEIETKDKVLSAIAFGQSIIVEVATDNIMLKLTPTQIIAILTKYAGIKAMLESGSLKTALAAMQTLKPDDNMPQWRIDKYVNKVKAYLGV